MPQLNRTAWPTPAENAPANDRDRTIVQSALWAASADALGWITEMSYGEKGVLQRTGTNRVVRPVAWKRKIGGFAGIQVDLPAGTYSDDTQLRLAVSRAIRGDGTFDVEAFAKIELTVWPTYALGAGMGSRAAAANLTRPGVNWFSNFFDGTRQEYLKSGGNGAAMRIQPHVWASGGDSDLLMTDVFRNAIVTHGHPHGFCGAIFHALSLEYAIRKREIPSPDVWRVFLDRCLQLDQIVEREPQLSTFWMSEWEAKAGETLKAALLRFHEEAISDINLVQGITHGSPSERYVEALGGLGCLTSQFRGSGWKTALAALSLAYFFREDEIEAGLVAAANELESDTDTIGTMAGALLGTGTKRNPEWPLQDSEYIASEARRLSSVARGEVQSSFSYPDLGYWNAPRKQYEAIGVLDRGLALAGLGELQTHDDEFRSKQWIWQWCELPFGQNVLVKRKIGATDQIVRSQLPISRKKADALDKTTIARPKDQEPPGTSGDLFGDEYDDDRSQDIGRSQDGRVISSTDTIDALTDEVIKSNFDDRTLGRMLNKCIDTTQSVEAAIGFSAIISKAKIARMKKGR